MADNKFDKLVDTDPRDSWEHEAHKFTPWLFKNLGYLSEALGIELEGLDTEQSVGQYSVDIVARNKLNGDRVMIENQLEMSDHRHLGQVLTYLAGTEAKSVVWIARGFTEPHRSAIRWLNDHTEDDFAFFAVRLRTVRIGDSSIAPVFEVVERPNNWERLVKGGLGGGQSQLTRLREQFWSRYLQQHPGSFAPGRLPNIYLPILDGQALLSLYVGRKKSGMFVRSPMADGEAGQQTLESILQQHRDKLKQSIDNLEEGKPGHYCGQGINIGIDDEPRWDELIEWMETRRKRYMEAFRAIKPDVNTEQDQ